MSRHVFIGASSSRHTQIGGRCRGTRIYSAGRTAVTGEVREWGHPMEGYPFLSRELRGGFQWVNPSEPVFVRVSGGVAWIPSKDVAGPTISAEVGYRFASDALAIVVGTDLLSMSLPFERQTFNYVDGDWEFVGSGSGSVYERMGSVRVGVELVLGTR